MANPLTITSCTSRSSDRSFTTRIPDQTDIIVVISWVARDKRRVRLFFAAQQSSGGALRAFWEIRWLLCALVERSSASSRSLPAPDLVEQYREAARSVDKILKGANPGDLPIKHPANYFLTLNAGAARKIGLVLPPALLQQATRVLPA